MSKQWTKQRPTKEDAGKWYLVRTKTYTGFRQIRMGENGRVFLCQEAHSENGGIRVKSYGTELVLWQEGSIEFWGPLEMPNDYR